MKACGYFIKAPIRSIKIQRKKYKNSIRRQMLFLKKSLEQEKSETKEMLMIYKRYTQRVATKEEMREANKQFIDIVKGLGLGMFAILPFAPITIPLILKLAKLVGVDILPSSFYNIENKK